MNGKDLSEIRERDLAAFRRSRMGFVFQDFNLLDTFSHAGQHLPAPGAGRCGTIEEMRTAVLRPIAEQLEHFRRFSQNTPMRCPADRSSGRRWPGR